MLLNDFVQVMEDFVWKMGGKAVRSTGPAGKGRPTALASPTADKPTGQALLESRGRLLHVAGHLRSDTGRGRERVQLFVDDVAHASG